MAPELVSAEWRSVCTGLGALGLRKMLPDKQWECVCGTGGVLSSTMSHEKVQDCQPAAGSRRRCPVLEIEYSAALQRGEPVSPHEERVPIGGIPALSKHVTVMLTPVPEKQGCNIKHCNRGCLGSRIQSL